LRGSWRRVAPLWAWILGVLAYVVIFLNLNYIHDYYQIPLLAVAAVCIAVPVDGAIALLRHRHPTAATIGCLALLATFAVRAIAAGERDFFKDDGIRVEAGALIRAHTPPHSLLVAAEDDRGTDCRDPRLLFHAQRYGWAISFRNLTPDLLKAYRRLGASHLAVLTRSGTVPSEFNGCQLAEHPLERRPWRVLLADLGACRGLEPKGSP
jgi:hypothetical protein